MNTLLLNTNGTLNMGHTAALRFDLELQRKVKKYKICYGHLAMGGAIISLLRHDNVQ